MNLYRYFKEREHLFAPAIKMLSKGIALKLDTFSSCTNFCKYCLLKGTKISLWNGQKKAIQRIKVGDEVVSINVNTMQKEKAIVKQTYKRQVLEIYELYFGKKHLAITGNHKVYTKEGWKETELLTKNDSVYSFKSNKFQKITRIIIRCQEHKVYNFGCTPNNNYIAGNMLVHNCYANELRASTMGRTGIQTNPSVARLLKLSSIVKHFEKAYQYDDRKTPFMNWSIRNRCYIELGTMGETFQDADLDFRITYNFLQLAKAYQMPLFINTKMNLLCRNEEYLNLMTSYPAPIIFCVTLTTEDDKLGKLYEPLAPLPSERLKTIKELNSYDHINSYVYMSPFIPSVTNRDTPAFVDKVIDAGIVGGYVRDFYMQGKTFQNAFWQKYIKENKQYLAPFPGGYHVKYDTKRDFYFQFQELASKYDKDFKVLGMKSKWFELNPYHGRVNFDRLPSQFKDGVLDFTAIPIMRKIRENMQKPQLLFWSKLGYKRDKIRLPDKIQSNEGAINTLMEGGCNCNTSDVHYEMDGYDWLVGGMWDGWRDKPEGMFGGLDYIYPVKEGNDYYKESDNFVYAYIPDNYRGLLEAEGQSFLFEAPKKKGLSIDIKNTKDFLIPQRQGGIEDKWM